MKTEKLKDEEALQNLERLLNEMKYMKSFLVLPMDLIIAGGSVRDLLIQNPPQDYDVFFHYNSPEDLTYEGVKKHVFQILKYLEDTYGNEEKKKEYKVRTYLKENEPESFLENQIDEEDLTNLEEDLKILGKNLNRIVIKIADIIHWSRKYPLQVMLDLGSYNAYEVLKGFDFNINFVGYDEKGFIISPEVDIKEILEALLEGGPLRTITSNATYHRLVKFSERYGCNTQKASQDLATFLKQKEETKFIERKFYGKGSSGYGYSGKDSQE